MKTLVAGLATAGAAALLIGPRRPLPRRLGDLDRASPPVRRAVPVMRAPLRVGTRLVDMARHRRAERRRDAELREHLPDVVELLRLTMTAGLNLHLALDAVAPEVDGAIGDALDEVRRRVRLGVRLADALDALLVLGDGARPLHLALSSAARDGAPLDAPLDRVADEARLVRRRHAEVRARRLPVQLLFPLVLCILPAFGLLTIVPLLAGSLGSLPL